MKIRIEQIQIYKKEMMQWLEKTCIIRKQGEKFQINEIETRKKYKKKSMKQKVCSLKDHWSR